MLISVRFFFNMKKGNRKETAAWGNLKEGSFANDENVSYWIRFYEQEIVFLEKCSYVVDVVVARITRFVARAELDVVIQTVVDKVDSVSHLDRVWDFTISLQVACLICIVLEDDVSFGILVVSKSNENNVSLVDPDLRKQNEK